ncbi:hypothetical protein TVAG_430010 [Trichomonas vaginalis G3]|uniref:Uncharacterized protein n=1 Tax=Trichomonas vaginalis (strain ATCC PRA-98 / G3) TaxID=412133 RepID=A2EI77_TRIV3|nr:hypothetical protein TVAGG3_0858750 [Trichomonas vaginalis G3]EAY07637.1 hypothetical protein TVAG_430010 [Trichomonas vaginalis G3]KAI5500515.1 hypothetical protein TVAGG3_0858750 [Trichomonas vaginalis G3]|eukprot:XP_001319860.1 hypothetical protein [Trichomonas vaginalis G3]
MEDPFEKISLFSYDSNLIYSFKWKVLLLGSVLKSATTNYKQKIFATFTLVLNILSYSIPPMYFISAFSSRSAKHHINPYDIFEKDTILSFMTDSLFTNTSMLVFCFIFYLVNDFVIIRAFNKPEIAKSLNYIMTPNFHSVFLPISSAIIMHCIQIILNPPENSLPHIFICISTFLAFVPYFIINILLVAIFGSSIILPNPQYTQWFDSGSINIVLYYFFTVVSFFSLSKLQHSFQCIVLGFIVLISLYFIYFQLKSLPAISRLGNEFAVMKLLLNLAFALVCLAMINGYLPHISTLIGLLPIALVLIFMTAYFLCYLRTKFYMGIIESLESVHSPTFEYFESILKHIKTEFDFRILIKLGIGFNSALFTKQEFLGYVMSRFPNSEWMLRYAIYFYSNVWGVDNTTYKYFLHLLSVEKLEFTTQLMLFEAVYCYMQTSEESSPLIKNDMKTFIEIISQFGLATKILWSHAPKSADTLYNDLKSVNEVLQLASKHIKKMSTLYQFNHNVYFAKSIYYADLKKNFRKANDAYCEGLQLFNEKQKYVTSTLNSNQRPYFSAPVNNDLIMKPQPSTNVLTFLSVRDHSGDLVKRKPNIDFKSPYMNLYANICTAERNQLLPNTPLITNWYQIFRIFHVIIILLFIGCLIFDHAMFKEAWVMADEYRLAYDSSYNFRIFIDTTEKLTYNYFVLQQAKKDKNYRICPFIIEHFRLLQKNFTRIIYTVDKLKDFVNTSDIVINNYTFMDCFQEFRQLVHITFTNYNNSYQYTTEQLINLRTTLINLSIIIFNRIHDRIAYGTSNVFIKHIYSQKIHFLVVCLTFFVMYLCMRWIFYKLKNDMFLVFSTLQYPVRKMLEKQYDTILSSKDPALAPPKPQSVFKLVSSMLIALAMVLLPIALSIQRLTIAKDTITSQNLPDDPLNITIPFMAYYEHMLLESRLCNNMMDKCPHVYDVRCAHHFFERAKVHPLIPIVSECSDDSWSRIMMLIMSYIASFAFYIFMKRLKLLMRTFWESSHLLFAIPVHIGRSNYIFTKLITGDRIDSNDVKEYVKELWNDTASYDLFGVLRFNQNGEVTETIGCAVKILGVKPKSIDNLKEILVNCGVSSTALEHFFADRTPTNVIYGRGTSPFMAYFSTPTEFFMKDESGDIISSRTDIINLLRENSKIERPPLVENAVLMFFKGVSKNDYDLINNESKSINDLILADGRFSSLIYTMSLNDKEKALQIYQFVTKMREKCPTGRFAVCLGDKIHILQPNRQTIEKSRVLGRPFHDAEYLVNCIELEDGKAYLQKEFIEKCELDFGQMKTKEVKVRDNTIQVAII